MNIYQLTIPKKKEAKVSQLIELAGDYNTEIRSNSTKDGTILRFQFETFEEMEQFKLDIKNANLGLY